MQKTIWTFIFDNCTLKNESFYDNLFMQKKSFNKGVIFYIEHFHRSCVFCLTLKCLHDNQTKMTPRTVQPRNVIYVHVCDSRSVTHCVNHVHVYIFFKNRNPERSVLILSVRVSKRGIKHLCLLLCFDGIPITWHNG